MRLCTQLFVLAAVGLAAASGCGRKDSFAPGYYGGGGASGSAGRLSSAGTQGGVGEAGTSEAGRSGGGGAGTGGLGGSAGQAGKPSPAGTSGGMGGAGASGGTRAESAAGGGAVGDVVKPFEGQGMPWQKPAPRATCSSVDMPEGELQGEGIENVRCNLTIKGKVEVAHFLSLAWHGDCAYVNAADATTVLDVSDSSQPKVVKTLMTTGMQNNWESMKVHEQRGLLVGYQANGPVLDVYDVSKDCKAPVLQSSLNIGGSGHSGNFSPDGTIYYASSLYTSEVFAVDITDPMRPRVITSNFVDTQGFPIGSHDLSIGKNGTRGYFTFPSLINAFNGTLAIVDTSEVQARAPNARGRSVKDLEWQDGAASQYPIPITYRGEDYLMVTDELGSGACGNPQKPHFGYAHIFDLRDELKPVVTAEIKTAAQDSTNCEQATQSAGTFFGVGTHYCNVDRRDDPRLLSCGLWAGGVRVFDIRNPWRPKEIAYFDTAGVDDMVPGLTRIRVETRELWVATTAGVFYVLKFADGVLDGIAAE